MSPPGTGNSSWDQQLCPGTHLHTPCTPRPLPGSGMDIQIDRRAKCRPMDERDWQVRAARFSQPAPALPCIVSRYRLETLRCPHMPTSPSSVLPFCLGHPGLRLRQGKARGPPLRINHISLFWGGTSDVLSRTQAQEENVELHSKIVKNFETVRSHVFGAGPVWGVGLMNIY